MAPWLREVADLEPLPDRDRRLLTVGVFEDVVGDRSTWRLSFDPHPGGQQNMGEDDIVDPGADRDPDIGCALEAIVDVARRRVSDRRAYPKRDPPQFALADRRLCSLLRIQPGAARGVLVRTEYFSADGAPHGEVNWRVRAGARF